MPSLANTLSDLSGFSDQIYHQSNHNLKPAGPFVSALLKSQTVLSLIRDAEPSEVRLFKFVGEEGAGVKKVEKRDGSIATPLREYNQRVRGSSQGEQVGVMLKTAMKLMDE